MSKGGTYTVYENGMTKTYKNGVLITTSPTSRTYTIPREPVKFDIRAMEKVCLMPLDDFLEYGDMYGEGEERYYYRDHGSSILAVAHLDSVSQHKHFVRAKVADEVIIYNAQLDDRLGAYIILELLPKMGMQCDILLTNGEETGRTTAKHFNSNGKEYNWMFSFDRMGTDVVMYQYETPRYAQMLRDSAFQVGKGSFSDIGALEHLKCAGFNFGCGYADYHSKLAHVKLSDTEEMIQSFKHFYEAHANERLEHDSGKTSYHGRHSSPPPSYDYEGGGWYNPNPHRGGTFLPDKPEVDDRPICAVHNGRVEEEDYIYSEDCCYPCYKLCLKTAAQDTMDLLADTRTADGFEVIL